MATIEDKKKFLNTTLHTNDNVLAEIYMIINMTNNKVYIGQTCSHRLNCELYKPYGCQGRLKTHISTALCNSKLNQSIYLNNAIRKYGADNFRVVTIEHCHPEDANDREVFFIKHYNSTTNTIGYNLNEGGNKGPTLPAQKKKLMLKSHEQYREQKFEKFKGIAIDLSKTDDYIREWNHERFGGVYYGVKIKNDSGRIVRTTFVGQHLTKEELRKQAVEFIYELAKRLRHT